MFRLLWLVFILSLSSFAQGEAVLYALDFTSQPPGDAVPWLREHGFDLRLDWKEVHPRFEAGGLRLSTDHPTAALFSCTLGRSNTLPGVKHLRISWGVDQFPEGADWEHGVNRLAIAVILSFGQERLPSGLPLGAHAEPYFISAFLGSKEIAGKIYTGTLWKEGGRYLCVKPPHPENATTDLEVDELFKNVFSKEATPPVSAISFQMNTKDTNGQASAVIRKIELLGDDAVK